MLDGYTDRATNQRLTGDWIIFGKHDGANYYLDLATHEEGTQRLLERLRAGSAAEFSPAMGIRIGVSPYQRAIEVGRRGAGRPAVAHPPPSMCLPCATLQWDGDDGGVMRDIINVSSEGWLADETVWLPEEDQAIQQFRSEILAAEEFEDKKRRDRAATAANLQRAFNDLLLKLKRAYGQPARDEADARSQHVVALRAIAGFLSQVGPDYLAHFANQFVTLAQALQDLNDGTRIPSLLTPACAKRSDQTMVRLGRAHVALAVATKQGCGYSRKNAAKWAAKKCPGLKPLITEEGSYCIGNSTDRDTDRDISRSLSLETAIISWCKDFSRSKPLRNGIADRAYRAALDELKARESDQLEGYADWLLQQALQIAEALRIADPSTSDETIGRISPHSSPPV